MTQNATTPATDETLLCAIKARHRTASPHIKTRQTWKDTDWLLARIGQLKALQHPAGMPRRAEVSREIGVLVDDYRHCNQSQKSREARRIVDELVAILPLPENWPTPGRGCQLQAAMNQKDKALSAISTLIWQMGSEHPHAGAIQAWCKQALAVRSWKLTSLPPAELDRMRRENEELKNKISELARALCKAKGLDPDGTVMHDPTYG